MMTGCLLYTSCYLQDDSFCQDIFSKGKVKIWGFMGTEIYGEPDVLMVPSSFEENPLVC